MKSASRIVVGTSRAIWKIISLKRTASSAMMMCCFWLAPLYSKVCILYNEVRRVKRSTISLQMIPYFEASNFGINWTCKSPSRQEWWGADCKRILDEGLARFDKEQPLMAINFLLQDNFLRQGTAILRALQHFKMNQIWLLFKAQERTDARYLTGAEDRADRAVAMYITTCGRAQPYGPY